MSILNSARYSGDVRPTHGTIPLTSASLGADGRGAPVPTVPPRRAAPVVSAGIPLYRPCHVRSTPAPSVDVVIEADAPGFHTRYGESGAA